MGFHGGSDGKESACSAGTLGSIPGLNHSSILVWEIPWAEEPGSLQFMGLQTVGHDWVIESLWYYVRSQVARIPRILMSLVLSSSKLNWDTHDLWLCGFLLILVSIASALSQPLGTTVNPTTSPLRLGSRSQLYPILRAGFYPSYSSNRGLTLYTILLLKNQDFENKKSLTFPWASKSLDLQDITVLSTCALHGPAL